MGQGFDCLATTEARVQKKLLQLAKLTSREASSLRLARLYASGEPAATCSRCAELDELARAG